MAIDFADDLDEMLSSDDHGVSVTWNAATFDGIFNKEYFTEEGGQVGTASSEPMLYVRSTNVNGIAEEDEITIDGDSYFVEDFEPDGTGVTMIRVSTDG